MMLTGWQQPSPNKHEFRAHDNWNDAAGLMRTQAEITRS